MDSKEYLDRRGRVVAQALLDTMAYLATTDWLVKMGCLDRRDPLVSMALKAYKARLAPLGLSVRLVRKDSQATTAR